MPNMAFQDMTEADGRWMARKIAEFTPAQIAAAIRAGEYSCPEDRDYLLATLLARRARIEEQFGRSPDFVELVDSPTP
jgi:hypothetical protein